MSTYTSATIIKDVRAVIDENTVSAASDALASDIDQQSLSAVIRAHTPDAVAVVEKAAPLHLMQGVSLSAAAITWDKPVEQSYSGSIPRPADFLRLLIFEMSDWDIPVFEPITAQSPLYAIQHSRFKGVRGNTARPVVALTPSRIEFFSCASDAATISAAEYMPIPVWSADNTISIPSALYRACIFQTAALTLSELGDTAAAQSLAALVPNLVADFIPARQ